MRADIRPDGRLNLAVLLEKLPKTERQPGEKLPRLLVRRVVLKDGTLTLSDRSGPTPASTTVSPINLELQDLSTLPDRRGEYTVSARLADGGTFAWRGAVTLEPLASQGEVKLTGMRPLTAWRFLQDELNVAEPRGELDFSMRYRAAYAEATPQLVLEDIRAAGRGIAIAAAGAKEPLLTLSSVSTEGGRFDLATRELVIPGVEVRDGAIAMEVDRSGALDWLKLVKAGAGSGTPESQAAPSRRPWKAKVESLRVAGLALRYIDRSRAKPIQVVAKDMTVGLSAALEERPDGMQAALDGIAVTLTGLALGEPGAAEPLAEFGTVALEDANLDLAERRLGAGRVTISGGLMKLARDKSGPAGVLTFAAAEGGLVRREVAGVVEEARAEGRPWRLVLDSLEASGTRIAARDTSFSEPIAYDGEIRTARVLGFRSDGKEPVRFEASVRIAQGGTVAASGALRLSGDELTARVKVDRFPLKPLQPLLIKRVHVELASGELTADLKADYRVRAGRQGIRATGSARVDNVRLNNEQGGERLLGWSSLAVNGIKLTLSPDDLKADEVRLTGLDTSIVINKDRSVNLVKSMTLAPGVTGSATGAAAPATVADVEARFPVTVGRVLFEKGTVDFADLSLVLPFAAKVQDLEGSIQGASTDRASRATVRLEGRVDEYGLARVNGSLRPFQPTSFLDLNVVFRNVEMPPLSAYSATFAGRRIASGRLALDLQYKINDRVLAGDNRVVLEKFTLGERVESPGALSLPLDLAVALLTDSDGKIDIAVPVRGNIDDPKFSYGQVIWQAITNLLTRIVTAPFRALGALFGGGAEQLEEYRVRSRSRRAVTPRKREVEASGRGALQAAAAPGGGRGTVRAGRPCGVSAPGRRARDCRSAGARARSRKAARPGRGDGCKNATRARSALRPA